MKWPNLDPSKVVYTKEELSQARRMVEDYQKTEEKKEGIEKKITALPTGMPLFSFVSPFGDANSLYSQMMQRRKRLSRIKLRLSYKLS